jgi:hypothetical protein
MPGALVEAGVQSNASSAMEAGVCMYAYGPVMQLHGLHLLLSSSGRSQQTAARPPIIDNEARKPCLLQSTRRPSAA